MHEESLFTELNLFSCIGALVLLVWLLKLVFQILWAFYFYVVTSLKLNVKWKDMGKWALVTGGSDGIGKAYAEELARRGFNIILVSRTMEKLNVAASEITKNYSVQTKVISVDFFDDSAIYETLKEALHGLDIGVLVNNVGMSYEHTEYFHVIPGGVAAIEKLLRSNIVSCTLMTRIVLPEMIKKKKGVIINISSLTALYPMPLLTVYAASKAYVDYFSRALHIEYKDQGIIVQSVLPGYVATKMSKRRTSLEIPSSERYVKSAIRTVGLESFTFGYFAHNIRGAVHQWLKRNMPTRVNMAIALYYMKKSREKFLKKRSKLN